MTTTFRSTSVTAAGEPTATTPSPALTTPLAPLPRRGDGFPEHSLRVRVRYPARHVVVLEASGVLDAENEPRFAEPVRHRLACTAPVVVLDLSGVSFLDTAGAVTMLEAAVCARMRGKQLRVVSSPAVDRLLGLIGVTDRFGFAASVQQAITARTADQPSAAQAAIGSARS